MRRHPFLWSFDLSTPTPTFTFPTDAERIAEVLADIKADLERRHVTDPKVWSGYPDDRDGDDVFFEEADGLK